MTETETYYCVLIVILIAQFLFSALSDDPSKTALPAETVKQEIISFHSWIDNNIQKLEKVGEIFFEYNEDDSFNASDSFDFKQTLCSNSDINLLSKVLYAAFLNGNTKKTVSLSNIFLFKENTGSIDFFFIKQNKVVCSFKAIWSAEKLISYDIEVITYIFFKILQSTAHPKHFSKHAILAISPYEYTYYSFYILTAYKQLKAELEKSLCNFTYLLYNKIYNNLDFQKFEKEVPFDKFLFLYEAIDDIPAISNIIFTGYNEKSKNFIKDLFSQPPSNIQTTQEECHNKIFLSQETIGTLTIFYIVGKSNNYDVFRYTAVIKTDIDASDTLILALIILNFFVVSARIEKTASYSGIVRLNY